MKKIIFIAIAALVVLGGGGAAAYYMGFADSLLDKGTEGEEQAEPLPPAQFFPLPALVTSANYMGRLRYLQVKTSLMSRQDEAMEWVQANIPLLQDVLISTIDSFSFAEFENGEGKEALRLAMEDRVRELMGEGLELESVLFTGFVIQ